MRHLALVLVLAIALCGCSTTSGEGVDALKTALKDSSFYLIGDAEVGSTNDLPRHIISPTEYSEMKCLAKAGYLSFVRDEAIADGNFHGFNNMFDTVRNGITRHISTVMTSLGSKVTEDFVEDENSRRYEATRSGLNLLKLRKDERTVDRILSNREIIKDSGRYRIIEALVTNKPTADGKNILEGCGQASEVTDFKVRELVKWDSFDAAWKEVAADTALEGHDFRTDFVNEILRSS